MKRDYYHGSYQSRKKAPKQQYKDYDGYEDKKICKAKVKARTLSDCDNEQFEPETLTVKTPVVLQELRVEVNVEADIELEEKAIEIKRIRKNVFITQCKVIPITREIGKVFFSGYIRKNIEYATADCISKSGVSGDIRHTTVNVPFECSTLFDFAFPPDQVPNVPQTVFSDYAERKKCCDLCGDTIKGTDQCQVITSASEVFNERIFCELENIDVIEVDIVREPMHSNSRFSNEIIFKKFTEKIVLFIRFKLLQNQQVPIYKNKKYPKPCHKKYQKPYEEDDYMDHYIMDEDDMDDKMYH